MGVKKYIYAIFAVTAFLMAFLGAGSASATVLCNESATTGCKSYGKGAILDGYLSETSATLTAGETLLDTCTSATFEGKTSTAGSSTETVRESIEELTWGSCTKTTDTITKGELEIHWISGTDNGTVTGKNISFTVNTVFGTCTYGTGESRDLGTLKGGNPATVEISATLVKTAGGFACPTEPKWVATYTVASPRPLYIGESTVGGGPMLDLANTGGPPRAGTRTCKFEARFEVCKFTVTNNSAFAVVVTIQEIVGPAGRYSIINGACKVGTEIAAGKFCTAEVRLEVNPGANWFNGLLVQVEEKGSGGKNLAGVMGLLET